MIVPMTTAVVAVMKQKYPYQSKMSASFDTQSQTVLTNFSIAFPPHTRSNHVHWDTNAVQMVKATICAHQEQHSHAQCHHPGVQNTRLNIFCLTGINKCNGQCPHYYIIEYISPFKHYWLSDVYINASIVLVISYCSYLLHCLLFELLCS